MFNAIVAVVILFGLPVLFLVLANIYVRRPKKLKVQLQPVTATRPEPIVQEEIAVQ